MVGWCSMGTFNDPCKHMENPSIFDDVEASPIYSFRKAPTNHATKPISRAPASPSCAALDSSHHGFWGHWKKEYPKTLAKMDGKQNKHEILGDVFWTFWPSYFYKIIKQSMCCFFLAIGDDGWLLGLAHFTLIGKRERLQTHSWPSQVDDSISGIDMIWPMMLMTHIFTTG